MSKILPKFKYHPNLYKLGLVYTEKSVCECCGEETEAYISDIYSAEEVECICLNCVASGKAAEKFNGDFIQYAERVSDPFIRDELHKRTPGYTSWQGEHWLACCDDYCEYLGTVGHKELAEMGIMEEVLEEYNDTPLYATIKNEIVKDGDACGCLFRCLHCKKYRIWVDLM